MRTGLHCGVAGSAAPSNTARVRKVLTFYSAFTLVIGFAAFNLGLHACGGEGLKIPSRSSLRSLLQMLPAKKAREVVPCVVPATWKGAPPPPELGISTQLVPGYGNWTWLPPPQFYGSGPEMLTPGDFQLVGEAAAVHQAKSKLRLLVGQELRVPFRCQHPLCLSEGSGVLLTVRTLGPAVPAGIVIYIGRGQWEARVRVYDAGVYEVEIVLGWSFANLHERFRSGWHQCQPGPHRNLTYQGLSILDRPLMVQVVAREEPMKGCPFREDRVPACKADELWSEEGRWHVVDNRSYAHNVPRMEWFPARCRLPSKEETLEQQASVGLGGGRLFVIFIGDSLMDLQFLSWQQHWNEWPSVFLSLRGGMPIRLDGIIRAIDSHVSLENEAGNKVAILFNSGLHDITYCIVRELRDCASLYSEWISKALSALLRWKKQGAYVVFRTTCASWQRWGNLAMAEHGGYKNWHQTLCQSNHAVNEVNKIALDSFVSAGISIIDGYNTTVSRTDHTEKISPSAAFVHFGPEVSGLHNHLFVLMTAQHFLGTQRNEVSANKELLQRVEEARSSLKDRVETAVEGESSK